MKVGTAVAQAAVGVFSVFICMSLSSAQQSKIYNNKILGYQLEYPSDFKVKTIGSATVFSSPEEDRKFAFPPSVNAIVVDLGESPEDLDAYYKQSKDAIERSYGQVTFLEDKKDKLSGVDAYRLVYVTRQKQADFKFMQIMCILKNRAYLLTYTALQGEQYNKLLKTAQAIIKSFKITAK
ncbi:MAG: PsbP-related protein [Candidatus Omnitrophota bacterium]